MMKSLMCVVVCCLATAGVAQGTWTQKASVPGSGRFWSAAFSAGGKGYGGTGRLSFSGSNVADFWEYDPVTDTWTQKADFPGGNREGCDGFAVGDKGYIAFGSSFIQFSSDVYQYDPAANTWTQKSSVPGGVGFAYSHGFVIDSTYYIGPENGTNNFYAYHAPTDTWSVKADYPGLDRRAQVAFATRGKGYIGLGFWVFGSVQSDMWQYDPVGDSWKQVADMGIRSDQSVAFGLGDYGYVYNVGGNKKDLYRYDPVADIWEYDNTFPSNRIANASAFATADRGYLLFGEETISGGNNPSNQLWEFTPGFVNSLSPAGISVSDLRILSVMPGRIRLSLSHLGGQPALVTLRDMQGRTLADCQIRGTEGWEGDLVFDRPAPGVYLLQVARMGEESITRRLYLD
ncbi:MAG: hypothetical protein SF053_00715 [Bacteroidia bacterium]|nr:hypothetical protein [Bacteroidia bacterium]